MALRPDARTTRPATRLARMTLVWLALVLALAQAVAIRHAYSHEPADAASHAAGKHPGGLAHCNACIAAAAIGGTAPPSAALVLPALAQQRPELAARTAHYTGAQQRPYAIRAPPLAAS